MSGTAKQFLAYLQDQQSAMIDLLREMVLAESPSSNPDSQEHVHAVLAWALEKLDFKVRRIQGAKSGGHLFATPENRSRNAKVQLLLGHYDTVWPLGTLSGMPFVVTDNVVKGPGVFDMKGGLVQLVFALMAIREFSLEPDLTPIIFVNSDEEIGSRGSARYIRRLAGMADRALILEPAMGPDGRLKTTRKGVGRFTVTIHGKAAHAGLDPGSGASAILELSHVIQKLFALNDADKGISVNVGTVDGGIRPNVIAPFCQAVADVRVATQKDADRVGQAIMNIKSETDGVRLHIDGVVGRPPMELTTRNQALWLEAKRLGAELGIDLHHGSAGGGSDGNTTSMYTATLDGLGAVGDGAHAHHEFLYIDKTIERTALLASLILAPSLVVEGAAGGHSHEAKDLSRLRRTHS